MPKLMLVDGTALAYRAHFAFIRNPLINSKGENTSASYGFTNILMRLTKEHQPDYIGVAFDTKAPTFRDEKYAQYKAQRPGMPEELAAQLPRIKNILKALNIAILEKDGYEADDVLAGLAKQAEHKGWMTYIVTGDKDLLQIVTGRIRVIRPRAGKSEESIYGPEQVKQEYGVEPQKIIDIFALSGDAVDNVPGVPGIGPKTATELITEFGSFEALYRNLDKVKKPRIQKLLEEHREQALLSKELVTLHLAQIEDIKLAGLKTHEPDKEKLSVLFKELEFGSLYHEFVAGQVKKIAPRVLSGKSELELLAARLEKQGQACFEAEYGDGGLSRICIFHEGQASIIKAGDLKAFHKVFSGPKTRKTTHDIKRFIKSCAQSETALNGPFFDTMIASYLLDPSRRNHESLESLAEEHLGISLHQQNGGTKKQTELSFAADGKEADALLARRADAVASLAHQFESQLKQKDLWSLFTDVEMPLCAILAGMEQAGVLLDSEFLDSMSKDLGRQIGKLEKEIYRLAGEEFNINSPKQLGTILFEKLKIGKARRTKTGYSTDVEALTRLSGQHPLPQAVLDYRQLFKLKSTYVDALPPLVNPATGRLHTTFNQTVAATGRLSSTNPNLQNIPIRTEEGQKIRQAFVAPPGWRLVSADYSQIELRIMAHLSGDERLLAAFHSGQDVHAQTARDVFGEEAEANPAEYRRRAKMINYSILYGKSDFGLAQDLKIPQREAKRFIQSYFATYPGVRRWLDENLAEATAAGGVRTMFGRIRPIPELKHSNWNVRSTGERVAANSPIQGAAADIIKLAMIRLDRLLDGSGLPARLLLQVHDELLLECPAGDVDRLAAVLREAMEEVAPLKVPLVVDIHDGVNWLVAK